MKAFRFPTLWAVSEPVRRAYVATKIIDPHLILSLPFTQSEGTDPLCIVSHKSTRIESNLLLDLFLYFFLQFVGKFECQGHLVKGTIPWSENELARPSPSWREECLRISHSDSIISQGPTKMTRNVPFLFAGFAS